MTLLLYLFQRYKNDLRIRVLYLKQLFSTSFWVYSSELWIKAMWDSCPLIIKILIWLDCAFVLEGGGRKVRSFTICNRLSFLGSGGGWSQSQLTLGEGRVHPGQVTILSQGWHIETNKYSHSHSHQFRVTCEPNLHVFGHVHLSTSSMTSRAFL